MNEIFFNEVGRLRSGWRFLCYLVPFAILYVMAGVALFAVNGGNPAEFAQYMQTPSGMTIYAAITLIIALIVGWLCNIILEGLPAKALGLTFNRTFIKDFLLGIIFGAISLTIAVLLAMPTNGISLTFNQTSDFSSIFWTITTSFIVFFIAALFEEVLFRGYILQTFFRANLAWFGIILTSLLFAFVHNGNPSANFLSFANTFLAGIWFGIAYLKTRSLWLTFGLHLSWNWFQGAFFGINVSGLSQLAPNPLLQATDQGPTWLTGGSYGIEAGITCTIAIIFTTILIYFLPILNPTDEMLALTSRENPKSIQLT